MSTWFSYGSNLDGAYFAEKIDDYRSKLRLENARYAVLGNYMRLLDNESFRHGFSYEIQREAGVIMGASRLTYLHDVNII